MSYVPVLSVASNKAKKVMKPKMKGVGSLANPQVSLSRTPSSLKTKIHRIKNK